MHLKAKDLALKAKAKDLASKALDLQGQGLLGQINYTDVFE